MLETILSVLVALASIAVIGVVFIESYLNCLATGNWVQK